MNTTFALELSKSKASKGQASILIRLTQNRKLKRIGTGITIQESMWNKHAQKVKSQHPYAKEYNKLLQDKIRNVLAVYSKLEEENEETNLHDIVMALTNNNSVNFFDFAKRTKLAQIKASNKLGTFRRYQTVLEKFKEYSGSSLRMDQVNYTLLQKYELHLLNNFKNGRDTVSSNLSVLRAVINEGIRHDVFKQRNPFDQIHLKYTDNTKEKLTALQLKQIFITPLPNIPSLLLARDFFLACFLAEGTRGGDMVAMQKENIINNCLVYNQQKTGKKMVIPIAEELLDIFNKYIGEGPFIFPMLNREKHINEIVINSKLTFINKYLKELAKYCGIFKKLSTHVARHTYTDLALQVSNGNIYQVQQSLGHSSVKTTEIYSRQRVNYDKQSMLPDIINFVTQKQNE